MNNSDLIVINMSLIIGIVYPIFLIWTCQLLGGI